MIRTSRLRCQEWELKAEIVNMITQGRDDNNENFNAEMARMGTSRSRCQEWELKAEIARMITQDRDDMIKTSRLRCQGWKLWGRDANNENFETEMPRMITQGWDDKDENFKVEMATKSFCTAVSVTISINGLPTYSCTYPLTPCRHHIVFSSHNISRSHGGCQCSCMEPICPARYGIIILLLDGIYLVFKIWMSLPSLIQWTTGERIFASTLTLKSLVRNIW